MTRHQVEQGETITSIAFRYGFFPDSLWNHPANRALKELRKNGDILLPGDVVLVPELRVPEYRKPTSQRHRFRRKGVPARLRIQFLDDRGPRASKSYVLVIDGRQSSGTTDGEGVLEVFIPPNAVQGEVRIEDDVYPLQLGHLDPITELAGVKKRLNNLGFFCGDPSEPADLAFEIAVRRFQERMKLEITGELDQNTRDVLEKIHDLRGAMPPTHRDVV